MQQSVQRTHAATAEPPIHAKSECDTVACWLYAEIMMPLPPMRVKWQTVIVARSCTHNRDAVIAGSGRCCSKHSKQ